MKLRQHLRELKEKIGEEENDQFEDEESTEMEVAETLVHTVSQDSAQPGPSTEEDLVGNIILQIYMYIFLSYNMFYIGVTKVSYIQPDPEPENDPESITLPPEIDEAIKEACTLKTADQLKTEVDTENEEADNVFIIEDTEHQVMDDNNMNAIADAVKATLASQPGLNLSGQLQLKVNQSDGKSTQVEVTTEDGSVIVMELMTEEETDISSIFSTSTTADVNEDGELKIFQCPDCPKSFARRIQLRRHASVHMQQRGKCFILLSYVKLTTIVELRSQFCTHIFFY